jgi:uncharacterized protein HemX
MDDITKSETPVPDAVPASSNPATPPTVTASNRKSLPFGVVVGAAVAIAILLVSIGYITYRGSNKKAIPLTSNQNSQQSTTETLDRSSEVDEQTVDSELEKIDDEVEDLNNTADFDESSLSDEELGL